MKRLDASTTRRWFWPIQIAVGIICISLSIWIVFSPQIGGYALFFLAGIGLIILGAERIVSGIKAEKSRRKYRILNIGIGAAIHCLFPTGLHRSCFSHKLSCPLSGVWIISQWSSEDNRRAEEA